MKGSIRLGRLFGISIGVNWTWIFIFALVTVTLATSYFPGQVSGLSPIVYWLVGAAAAILLFVAVLAHEMAHSLVSRAQGMPVHSITLFIFGGVSNIQERPPDAKSEFLMAIVGPLTSLLLGGLFLGLVPLVQGVSAMVTAVLVYLGAINILLGLFNLIPGFPMDGGRVLRSIIWGIGDDRDKATRIASFIGLAIAWLFIIGGIIIAFTANFISGLWLAFIGWFLSQASGSRYRRATQQEEHGQT